MVFVFRPKVVVADWMCDEPVVAWAQKRLRFLQTHVFRCLLRRNLRDGRYEAFAGRRMVIDGRDDAVSASADVDYFSVLMSCHVEGNGLDVVGCGCDPTNIVSGIGFGVKESYVAGGSGTNFLASSISPRMHKAMNVVPLSVNASLNTSKSFRAFAQWSQLVVKAWIKALSPSSDSYLPDRRFMKRLFLVMFSSGVNSCISKSESF